MTIQPDRARMSQLVASEMGFFGSQFALSFVVGSTTLVSMVAMLFSVFYYIGQSPTDKNMGYLIISLLAFVAFLTAYAIYRINVKARGLQYNIVMAFSSVCYTICAISGFVLARTAWMWQLTDISPSAYHRYISTVFTWCFLAPALLVVAYVILLYVLVDYPLPYVGWSYKFYIFIPISILVLVALGTRSKLEYSMQIATVCALLYLSLTLMMSTNFLIKLILNNFLISTPARYETFVKAKPSSAAGKMTAADIAAAVIAANRTPSAAIPASPTILTELPSTASPLPELVAISDGKNDASSETAHVYKPEVNKKAEAFSFKRLTSDAKALSERLKDKFLILLSELRTDKSDLPVKPEQGAAKSDPVKSVELESELSSETKHSKKHIFTSSGSVSEDMADAQIPSSVKDNISSIPGASQDANIVDEILSTFNEKELDTAPSPLENDKHVKPHRSETNNKIDDNPKTSVSAPLLPRIKQIIVKFFNDFTIPEQPNMESKAAELDTADRPLPSRDSETITSVRSGKTAEIAQDGKISDSNTSVVVNSADANSERTSLENKSETHSMAPQPLQNTSDTQPLEVKKSDNDADKNEKTIYSSATKRNCGKAVRTKKYTHIKAHNAAPETKTLYCYTDIDGYVMAVKPAPPAQEKAVEISTATEPTEPAIPSEITNSDSSAMTGIDTGDSGKRAPDSTAHKSFETGLKSHLANRKVERSGKATVYKKKQHPTLSPGNELEIGEVIGTGIGDTENTGTVAHSDKQLTLNGISESAKIKFIAFMHRSKSALIALVKSISEPAASRTKPNAGTVYQASKRVVSIPKAADAAIPAVSEPSASLPPKHKPTEITAVESDSCCDNPDEPEKSKYRSGHDWFDDVQSQLGKLGAKVYSKIEMPQTPKAAPHDSDTARTAQSSDNIVRCTMPPVNSEPDIVETLEEPDTSAISDSIFEKPNTAAAEELLDVLDDITLCRPDENAEGGSLELNCVPADPVDSSPVQSDILQRSEISENAPESTDAQTSSANQSGLSSEGGHSKVHPHRHKFKK
ncbi:MAG: hypothetical protein RR009_00040 [Oscillospiraceae bacterium]